MGPFIPDLVSDMMEPVRSFAHIKLPFPGNSFFCLQINITEISDFISAICLYLCYR